MLLTHIRVQQEGINMIKVRNKKQIKAIWTVWAILLSGIMVFFYGAVNLTGSIFNVVDFKALDLFYKLSVQQGKGPQASFTPEIIYLNITDETYNFFNKNHLDRKDIATLNYALSQMHTEAVIYDIIFARKSTQTSDFELSRSLDALGNAYMPTALVLSDKPYPFIWKDDVAHERFRRNYLGKPDEKNITGRNYRPFYALKALMQQNDFAIKASGSGDINAAADSDGIYRHIAMLARVDDKYFPTISLSVFLDWAGIPFNAIKVEWGEKITIPASNSDHLDNDVTIPIDSHGRTFIPFVQVMGRDFTHMTAHKFIEHSQDINLKGNLLEKFEGNFVFIGDVAIGTSDLGYTPLQKDAPLIIIHASLLNAMLTNTFYSQWPTGKTLSMIFILLTVMACISIIRSSWILYITGTVIVIVIPVLTWFEFIDLRLFPVVTVLLTFLLIFFTFIVTLETSGSKERAFIRNTFARYVPEKVVNTLLAQPEMVSLGGEERVITVLFSDIANFTTISESLSPTALVNLLNEYFSEMVEIIMQNGGIIDKFQGDSIMAEFGVPIPVKNHADQAVTASLQMLNRLSELRETWKGRDENSSSEIQKSGKKSNTEKNSRWYEIYCRIGINTNKMIVGNMGSKSVLDYTVIGDAVNLASRLESANKLYGTHLMISEFTHNQLTPGRFKSRMLDYIRVKGKHEPVFVYEVYGEIDEHKKDYENRYKEAQKHGNSNNMNQEDLYYITYHKGFEAYLEQKFIEAKDLFQYALMLRDGDIASVRMVERIEKIETIEQTQPHDSQWDGAISLMIK